MEKEEITESRAIQVQMVETDANGDQYLVVHEEDLEGTAGQIYAIEEPNAKSIEINIEIIKTIFMNCLSLYEALLLKNCHSCDIIRSEEFIRVHNNFVEVDGLFKVFDLSFDKTALENLVKKPDTKKSAQSAKPNKKGKTPGEHPCLISACAKTYSSFECVQVHFLKSHCCPIPAFEPAFDPSAENDKINFNEIARDNDGKFICQFDEYCHYTTNDRSNFRVHRERHRMAKRFNCFICQRYFTAKEPLMIHFVRTHFSIVPWDQASTDIRQLRKSIRKCTNSELLDVELENIIDIDEDLTGPESLQKLEISAYISQAINNGTVTRGDTSKVIAEVNASEEVEAEEDEGTDVTEQVEQEGQDYEEEEFEELDLENEEGTQNPKLKTEYYVQQVSESEIIIQEIPAKREMEEIEDIAPPPIKKVKTREKKFRCIHEYCQQDFYGEKQLLIHLKSNHDPENRHACDHEGCQSRFKSSTLLAQHQRRHKCTLQCEHCEYRTHLPAQMEKHQRQHTGEEQPHVCPECEQRFTYLGQMANHRKKEHKIIESLTCDSPNCGKIFKTVVGLNKHKREFHMNIRNTVSCEWQDCHQFFTTKSNYQKHLRIHTNERPVLCPYPGCDKTFRLKETMLRHQKTHGTVGESDY